MTELSNDIQCSLYFMDSTATFFFFPLPKGIQYCFYVNRSRFSLVSLQQHPDSHHSIDFGYDNSISKLVIRQDLCSSFLKLSWLVRRGGNTCVCYGSKESYLFSPPGASCTSDAKSYNLLSGTASRNCVLFSIYLISTTHVQFVVSVQQFTR